MWVGAATPTAGIRGFGGGAWEPLTLMPSCPLFISTYSPTLGTFKGTNSLFKPTLSLRGAHSSIFEGHGEQLHTGCFSWDSDLSRHVHVLLKHLCKLKSPKPEPPFNAGFGGILITQTVSSSATNYCQSQKYAH